MMTEYHCHILPGIDDGSDSVDTSLKMVKMMKRVVPEFISNNSKFSVYDAK